MSSGFRLWQEHLLILIEFYSKKTWFKKPTNNSIDSPVSDRDFAIDFLSAAATCAMHLSRMAEDFIILILMLLDL